MIEIEIIASEPKDFLSQIQGVIGGQISERWNDFNLVIKNKNASGNIRYIPFDWGVNLLNFTIKFKEEVVLKIKDHKDFNPLRFVYPSAGNLKHRFASEKNDQLIEQFQSLIFANKDGGYHYITLPANQKVEINVIQIIRKDFLRKKTTNVATLNKKLYEVFVDTNHKKQFSHHGSLHLRMADLVKKLHKIKAKGMLRILKIEAKIYEILSLHIQQHNRLLEERFLPENINKSEIKIIKKVSNAIVSNPAKQYSLKQLSFSSGLTQAKLQEGFKFLYNRTVTEYIRHLRLELARDMLKNTDLNISQVVYSIGFSSRSYFSKIFKEKFGITPNQFKKQVSISN